MIASQWAKLARALAADDDTLLRQLVLEDEPLASEEDLRDAMYGDRQRRGKDQDGATSE